MKKKYKFIKISELNNVSKKLSKKVKINTSKSLINKNNFKIINNKYNIKNFNKEFINSKIEYLSKWKNKLNSKHSNFIKNKSNYKIYKFKRKKIEKLDEKRLKKLKNKIFIERLTNDHNKLVKNINISLDNIINKSKENNKYILKNYINISKDYIHPSILFIKKKLNNKNY